MVAQDEERSFGLFERGAHHDDIQCLSEVGKKFMWGCGDEN